MIDIHKCTYLTNRQDARALGLIHEAAHILTPLHEGAPMLVSLLQGGSITEHHKAILGSSQRYIHPPPIREESNPTMMVGSDCGEDD